MDTVNCTCHEKGKTIFIYVIMRFHSLILTRHVSLSLQSYYARDNVAATIIMADIVKYSKIKWPILFSRYYETTRISGNFIFV